MKRVSHWLSSANRDHWEKINHIRHIDYLHQCGFILSKSGKWEKPYEDGVYTPIFLHGVTYDQGSHTFKFWYDKT